MTKKSKAPSAKQIAVRNKFKKAVELYNAHKKTGGKRKLKSFVKEVFNN